ncbi:hypothetical protein Scep_018467 [Stephania cephalantha]|uniref:Pentatricopeptide repeat-containing protein n=1 Tax=Stephania cephalantha TaxID=152367 RepID=A0AAP0NL66_9MAGN
MISTHTNLISRLVFRPNKFHSSSRTALSSSNSVQSSKLLSECLKLGNVNDAKKLFDEIPNKSIVAWSIMIYGYAANARHKESIRAFSDMRVSGIYPNSFTIVGVLVNSASSKDLKLGQCVHGLIVKNGLEFDPIVGTALLDAYAKCKDVYGSCKFFDEMENPSVITCSAMIAGLIENELFDEALMLFNRLRRESGLVPNYVTMLSVVRGCNALESDHSYCRSIHCFAIKTGLWLDVSVINAILDSYSNLGDLEAAKKIFDDIASKDVISWTTIMGLLVRHEYASDALKLFYEMKVSGINMDVLCLVHVIMAYALLGDIKLGRLVHCQAIASGFALDILVANAIVAMYSKCGDLKSSKSIFSQINGKTLVSWTSMISCCVQNGRPREAFEFLSRMRIECDFNLDAVILLSLLTGCGELGSLELCQQLHSYVYKAGFAAYKSIQNSVLSTYSKSGEMEFMQKMFEGMDGRNLVSWNAMISGYAINGHGKAAVSLFREMRNAGQDPDEVTYLSVLTACSHCGLVEDGLLTFKAMVEEEKIIPSKEHYGCAVDLLARAGHLSDAGRFMNSLPETIGPDVWKALLSGCHIHGNVELAEFAADRVFQLNPKGSDHIVLLSNVYASVGRYKDAEVLRLSMNAKGLTKDPGISLLNE